MFHHCRITRPQNPPQDFPAHCLCQQLNRKHCQRMHPRHPFSFLALFPSNWLQDLPPFHRYCLCQLRSHPQLCLRQRLHHCRLIQRSHQSLHCLLLQFIRLDVPLSCHVLDLPKPFCSIKWMSGYHIMDWVLFQQELKDLFRQHEIQCNTITQLR